MLCERYPRKMENVFFLEKKKGDGRIDSYRDEDDLMMV